MLQKEMMETDLKTVYTELLDEAGLSLAEEQKNFFDYLHFSPIKVRLPGKNHYLSLKKVRLCGRNHPFSRIKVRLPE